MDTKRILKVIDWNREWRNKGQYQMIYTLGNGAYLNEARKNGYVVQRHHKEGGEGSKYFSNIKKAREYYNSLFNNL